MIATLLLRGMLAGVLAAILAFGFARTFGEPQIESAIALEEQGSAAVAHEHAADGGHDHGGGEGFSRQTQAGIGLLTGLIVIGAAVGGLFSMAFAFFRGRFGPADPKALSLWLALAGFVVLAIVPGMKYPATPPAVGVPETIGFRTILFFAMIAISLAASIVALLLSRRIGHVVGGRLASLAACGVFAAIVGLAFVMLPSINEVPADFSTDLLWRFRFASLVIHAVLWATLGIVFGLIASKKLDERNGQPV